MSEDSLQISYAQQLDRLLTSIRQGWVWPSPAVGFVCHVFQTTGTPLPFEAGSLAVSPDVYQRFDQAPVLAAVGYALSSSTPDRDEALLSRWWEGLTRVSTRTAFPRDRQSFVYRPCDLLGIAVGLRHHPNTDTSLRDWFRGVLEEAEGKLADGSWWHRLISRAAAEIHGVSWQSTVFAAPAAMTVPELALMLWLGDAYRHAFEDARKQAKACRDELRRRALLEVWVGMDVAEAGVVYYELQKAVVDLLGQGIARPHGDENSIRVFISYSHDRDVWARQGADPDTHRKRVLNLAQRLRDEGIDCIIDQLVPNPPEGWPRWMMNQIEETKYVLVVATETYDRRFRGREERNKGFGAQWEGATITQELYEANGRNEKFIPIVFGGEDTAHIPLPLRSATHYDVSADSGYDEMYFYLTGQPAETPRPIGNIRRR